MYLAAPTLDDLLVRAYLELQKQTQVQEASRGKFKELTGVLLELTAPRARLSRSESRGKIFSGLGEFLWYMSGSNSLAFIKAYISKYEEDSEDGYSIYGGYGPRIFDLHGHDQLQNVIGLLSQHPSTRRAVIQIFGAADISKRRREIPCTCTLQFLVRNKLLDMHVHMRSNDAVLGLSHDVFAFTMLQEYVASVLKIGLGVYKHFVGSFHVYEQHFSELEAFLDEGYQSSKAMQAMPRGTAEKQLAVVKEIEMTARIKGEFPKVSDFDLNTYWSDISRLTQIHFAFGKNKDEVALAIMNDIEDKNYLSYANNRIIRKQRKPQSQLTLGF